MPASSLKRGLKVCFLSLFLAVTVTDVAHGKSCVDLSEDLRAMKRAQASLLDSMVKKNESMADTLDQYAQNFSYKKNLRKADVVGMKKSASAFRRHKQREEKLVRRFNDKTEELMSLVEDCLKSKTIASQ